MRTQALEPEKELLALLQDMEVAVTRCRRRQPLPAAPAGLGVDLPVLAPLLLQQVDVIERAALAGVRPLAQPPAGAPECRLFVKEGTKCVRFVLGVRMARHVRGACFRLSDGATTARAPHRCAGGPAAALRAPGRLARL